MLIPTGERSLHCDNSNERDFGGGENGLDVSSPQCCAYNDQVKGLMYTAYVWYMLLTGRFLYNISIEPYANLK